MENKQKKQSPIDSIYQKATEQEDYYTFVRKVGEIAEELGLCDSQLETYLILAAWQVVAEKTTLLVDHQRKLEQIMNGVGQSQIVKVQ